MTQSVTEQAYTIDAERGVIVLLLDQDTCETEVIPIRDLIDVLAWLRSRETDLRYLVQREYPRPIRQLMTQKGQYMIGLTENREKVKIRLDRYQEVANERERVFRANWLYDLNEKKKTRIEIEYLDNSGNQGRLDASGKPIAEVPEIALNESDCPSYMVQASLDKLKEPEYWLYKPDNIDAGKSAKWK